MYTSKSAWCSAFGPGGPMSRIPTAGPWVPTALQAMAAWPLSSVEPCHPLITSEGAEAQRPGPHGTREVPHVCAHMRMHTDVRSVYSAQIHMCARTRHGPLGPGPGPDGSLSPLPPSVISFPSSLSGETEACQPENHHVLAFSIGGFQRHRRLTLGAMLPLGHSRVSQSLEACGRETRWEAEELAA